MNAAKPENNKCNFSITKKYVSEITCQYKQMSLSLHKCLLATSSCGRFVYKVRKAGDIYSRLELKHCLLGLCTRRIQRQIAETAESRDQTFTET